MLNKQKEPNLLNKIMKKIDKKQSKNKNNSKLKTISNDVTVHKTNNKKYIGEFKEGYKNGYGIMTWPNGEKYKGSWVKDTFKFGTYFWPNGNIYFGNFSNEGVNGYGSFYSSLL